MLQCMKTFDIWKHAANMTTSVYTKPPEQSNGNCFWRAKIERDPETSSSFNRR